MRKSSAVLLFILSLLVSCQEEKKCSEAQSKSIKDLQSEFLSLHDQSVTREGVLSFQSELKSYLSSYEDAECSHEGDDVNYHSEVKALSKEIDSTNSSELSAKVIYGDDDRIEVANASEMQRALAKSVAAMIQTKRIDSQNRLETTTLGEAFGLCSDQQFIDQISPASCSGFLVGEDLLVTAGHCMTSKTDCSDSVWLFDFHEGVTTADPQNTYKCKEIVSQKLDSQSDMDFAVVRLDRKVSGRVPLKFRRSGKVADQSGVFVIGHPSGLPAKVAPSAWVRANENSVYFSTNLDTFAGNSGSPVFNSQTGLVEGILVRGETDYKFVNKEDGTFCREVFTCAEDGCRGEDVTRITQVQGLPESLAPSLSDSYNALYKSASKTESQTSAFSMSVVSVMGVNLSGKKFMDKCVSHVTRDEDPKDWLEKSEGSCSQAVLESTHAVFKSLVDQ